MLTSLNVIVMLAARAQLSVAVAVPVPVGVLSSSQLIVTSIGQVITGSVTSSTVITCTHSSKLLLGSVALQVLVIV